MLKKENHQLKKIIKELKTEKKEQKKEQKKIIIETVEKNNIKKGKEKELIYNIGTAESSTTNNKQQQIIATQTIPSSTLNTDALTSQVEFPYLQATTKSNESNLINHNNNNKWTKRQRNQFYRKNNPSKKQLELATRTFEEKIEDNNFINVYLPCKRRMKPSEIRKKLAFLGIDLVQILDTYCPDWDTVLLLIHEKYKETLETKLQKAGIMLKEYNYLHISHLRDSRLVDLTIEEKVEKLKQIRNNCSMRALEFIRDPVKKSVARCLHRQNIITQEQLKKVLTGRDVENAVDTFKAPVEKNNEEEQQAETEQDTVMETTTEFTGTAQQATNQL